jgi:hypothetical protein
MRNLVSSIILYALVACCFFLVSLPSFAKSKWTFEIVGRGYGQVVFGEENNEIFALQCTRHSGVQVSYISPDQTIRQGPATLTLSNSKGKIPVEGSLDFVKFLSNSLDDNTLVNEILKMIASGNPITILLGKDRYNIPGAHLRSLVNDYTCG